MNNGKNVVLVVEDSAIIRMGAVDLVLSAGYEVLEARDADEAIRILESRSDIDLVFTDVPYIVDYTGYTEDHLKIKNDRLTILQRRIL